MFLIRISLAVVLVMVSITCNGAVAGAGGKNDRTDEILAILNDMKESVEKVYRMEDETAEHMSKTEDRVAELEKKVEKVDNDVVNPWFNWKNLGRGAQDSCDEQVFKYHTTLEGCLSFCTEKRQNSGPAWNGAMWDKDGDHHCTCNQNDRGHHKYSYLHFRVQ